MISQIPASLLLGHLSAMVLAGAALARRPHHGRFANSSASRLDVNGSAARLIQTTRIDEGKSCASIFLAFIVIVEGCVASHDAGWGGHGGGGTKGKNQDGFHLYYDRV